MESGLNEKIETTTDEYILIIKSIVDNYIVSFKQNYDIDERNQMIMKVYDILVKKTLPSANAKFFANKNAYISTLVKSCMIRQKLKHKKNL
jgi:hypothetical protein